MWEYVIRQNVIVTSICGVISVSVDTPYQYRRLSSLTWSGIATTMIYGAPPFLR